MRILLTGRNGQVGWDLERTLAPLGEVLACDRQGLDLARPDRIREVLREAKPDVVVNAAAYTAVDRAQSEREAAFAVNAEAPGVMAEEAKRLGALLVHYSTDYVFDGEKAGSYTEDDEPGPLGVYGESKLAGERAVQAAGCRHLILRTCWVYAPRGRNFFLTILRAAREKPELKVVDDQQGTPTPSVLIAETTARLLGMGPRMPEGVLHLAAAGRTTWHGFAKEIVRLDRLETRVTPIPTAEYPTPARRPRNSVLSTEKLEAASALIFPDWRAGLSATYAQLRSPKD